MSSEFTADTVPDHRLDVRVRNLGGTLLVALAEDAFELSDSSAFLWRAIDGARTVSQIAESLATEYGIDGAEALADTVDALNQLYTLDLIRQRQPDPEAR